MKGYFYRTKLGNIFIAEDGLGISEIALLPEAVAGAPDSLTDNSGFKKTKDYVLEETALIKEASDQLIEYMEGKRKTFSVRLNPKGTEFQQKVWKALCDIPYGETRSYKQIAEAVGNKNASRAVGMANHNNPIMCIIPCHRVIGANGSLVGYAGGLDTKAGLLKLEEIYR